MVGARERCKTVLDEGVAALSAEGLEVQGHVRDGEAVDQIVDYAQSVNADLIVLGHKHQESQSEPSPRKSFGDARWN